MNLSETNIIPGENIYGLYGTFYKEPLFDGFLLGNHGDHEGGELNFMGPNSLHDDLINQSFQSARWQGRIVIPEDAVYTFFASDDSRVCIQLEEAHTGKIYNPLMEKEVSKRLIRKGVYKILIEYIPLGRVFANQNVLTLCWESSRREKKDGPIINPIKKQVIPKENLLFPDFSENPFVTRPRQTLFKKFLIPQIPPQNGKDITTNYIASSDDMALSNNDSNPVTSPLSPAILKQLQNTKDDLHSAQQDGENQEKWWNESRQSRLPSRKFLTDEQKEAEQKELKKLKEDNSYKGLGVEKKIEAWNSQIKTQTWDALYWDEDAPCRLNIDYDLDNPHAKYADADGDGLSNYDSTNGFTIIGASHRPWLPEYDTHEVYKNYPRYTCSYRKASTAGDPYTDLQKTMQNVRNLSPVTKNPLVAAAPCVSAQMEGYSINKIEDITTSSETGYHFTTSNRLTVSNTNENHKSEDHSEHLDIGVSSAGISGGGGLAWSHGLSEGKSDTNSIESSSDTTTDQVNSIQKHWNTGDAAYFNAYIRYVNTGTASMLKAKPSLNFGVYDKNIGKVEPVCSVTPPEKTAGEVLNLEGDSFYPSPELMPLVIQTKDTFNSARITLGKEQFESVLNGNPMRLEVPQVSGVFQGKVNETKNPLVVTDNKEYEWAEFLPNIDKNTARMTLVLPDGTIYDRKIAAPKVSNDKSENELGNGVSNRLDLYADQNKVPVLTIGKAIQMAFETHPNSFIFENKAGIEFDLNRVNVNLIFDEKTNTLLQEKFKNKSKTDENIKTYYDLELYQGMRIVIEVPPIVTVQLTENKTPDEEKIPRQIMLTNNYKEKTINYKVVVAPSKTIFDKLIPENQKNLSKTGVLKPAEKCAIGLEYISDQDVIQVWIGPDDKTERKLLFSQAVAKLPGFVAQKETIPLALIQNGYHFSEDPEKLWVGDATQQSKCKGIKFFVYPKEQWDNIASYELKVKSIDKNKGTQTYGPLLKTQLNVDEITEDGKEGYKVYLDFSLFNTWNNNAIQFGDEITITGKVNEVKKRLGWDKVTACTKGIACDLSTVYIPYEEPRTCQLLKPKVFPTQLSREYYTKGFRAARANKESNVYSTINSKKIPLFDNVVKNVTIDGINPIIVAAIKEIKMELTGRDKKESAYVTGYKLEDGNLKVSFRTDTTVNVELKEGLVATLFRKGVELVGQVDLSYDTYNASIPGLLTGNRRQLKLTATIDEQALSKEDFARYGNSITIYDGQI